MEGMSFNAFLLFHSKMNELMKTKKATLVKYGSEKGKLLPTDIGIVVNDFLMANFPNIMDYNFTANE